MLKNSKSKRCDESNSKSANKLYKQYIMSNSSSENIEEYWDSIRKIPTLEVIRRKKPAWTRLETLVGAKLQRQDLKGVNFFEKNLEGAHLEGAHLEEAYLIQANLKNAKLIDAYLNNANLTNAYLQNADLRGAVLEGAVLGGANLTKAKLQKQQLSNMFLRGAILEEAHLENANLRQSDLVNVNLIKAHLEGAFLIKADLRYADLREADLRNADLREADLTNADLREADLTNADLTGADLTNANLTGADLEGVDFTEVILNDKQRRQIEVSINEKFKNPKKFGPFKYLQKYLDKPHLEESNWLSDGFSNSTSSDSPTPTPTPNRKNFSRQLVPAPNSKPSVLANYRTNTSNKISISPNFLSNNRDLYNLIMDIDLPENFKFQLEGENRITSKDNNLTKIIFDKLLSFYTDKYFIKNKDKLEFILLRKDVNFDELYNNTLQLIKIAKAAKSDIKLNINPEIIQLLLSEDPKKTIGNRKNFNTLFANVKSKLKNKSVKNMSESFMNNLLKFIIKDTKNLDQLAKTFKIELAFRRILNEYGFTSWEQYIDMAEFIKIFSDSFTHL
jgi:uncharacterized protein YjbI with pentapeptide repeats